MTTTTGREFAAAELEEIKIDWTHSKRVRTVAELHGCPEAEIKGALAALGIRPKKRKYNIDGGRRPWEEKYPAKAKCFAAMLRRGMSMPTICRELGIGDVSTGYRIRDRMRKAQHEK